MGKDPTFEVTQSRSNGPLEPAVQIRTLQGEGTRASCSLRDGNQLVWVWQASAVIHRSTPICDHTECRMDGIRVHECDTRVLHVGRKCVVCERCSQVYSTCLLALLASATNVSWSKSLRPSLVSRPAQLRG
jgi:hypothetical protein